MQRVDLVLHMNKNHTQINVKFIIHIKFNLSFNVSIMLKQVHSSKSGILSELTT